MRATSGAWLHAQLTVLVAACVSSGCGKSTSNVDADAPGAGAAAAQGGNIAQGGHVTAAGNAAQGGEIARGGNLAQAGATGQGGAARGGSPGLICSEGQPKLTANWLTEPPLDYVALVWGDPPEVREDSGTLCGGASVTHDCQVAYETLDPSVTWTRGVPLAFPEYFTYTRGDGVGTIGSLKELAAILGNIDTPNEAAVWLYAQDRPLRCEDVETVEDGFVGYSRHELSDCPVTYQSVVVHVAPDGTLEETKVGEPVVTNVCAGRRPETLGIGSGARGGSALAGCLAEMAELELASIAAFVQLEQQLDAHGAPEHFLERCRAAAQDEVEHARRMAALARRFGAEPQPVRTRSSRLPSLRQMALDNMREGCVRELYGALVATHQASHAQDPQVRQVLGRVARDESEHAALSLDLAAWFETQLGESERAEVEAERLRAIDQLRAELRSEPDPQTCAVAGLPSAVSASALLDALAIAWGSRPHQQLFS